jgi:hypothetical protein
MDIGHLRKTRRDQKPKTKKSTPIKHAHSIIYGFEDLGVEICPGIRISNWDLACKTHLGERRPGVLDVGDELLCTFFGWKHMNSKYESLKKEINLVGQWDHWDHHRLHYH